MKKLFVKVLSLVVAVCAVFGLVNLNTAVASAEEVIGIQGYSVNDSASARTDAIKGIRFTASLTEDAYNAIMTDKDGKDVRFGIEFTRPGKDGATTIVSEYTGSIGNENTVQTVSFIDGAPYEFNASICYDRSKVKAWVEDKYKDDNLSSDQVEQLTEAYLIQAYSVKLTAQSYYVVYDENKNVVEKVYSGAPVARSLYTTAYATYVLEQTLPEEDRKIEDLKNFLPSYLLEVREANLYVGINETAELNNIETSSTVGKVRGFDFAKNFVTDITDGTQSKSYASISVNVANYATTSFSATYTFADEFFNGLTVGKSTELYAFTADGKVYALDVFTADKLISTAQDLVDAVQIDEDYTGTGYYALTNNIDMSGVAINHSATDGNESSNKLANVTKLFTGTFDGRGYVIDNFDASKVSSKAFYSSTTSGTTHNGLFYCIGAGVEIKNVAFTNMYATKSYFFAASINGVNTNRNTFKNIYIHIDPNTVAPYGFSRVGDGYTKLINTVIEYETDLMYSTKYGRFATSAFGITAVENGAFVGTGANGSSNNIVITPNVILGTPSTQMATANKYDAQPYAYTAYSANDLLNTTLQIPTITTTEEVDGKVVETTIDYDWTSDAGARISEINGGRAIKNNEQAWLCPANGATPTREIKIGFWDDKAKKFIFDNPFANNYINTSRCSHYNQMYRFDSYSDFALYTPNAYLGASKFDSDYWTIINGAPYFKKAYTLKKAGKTITLNDGTLSQSSDYILEAGKEYEVSVEGATEFSVESLNPSVIAVNDNNISLDGAPLNDVIVELKINALVDGMQVSTSIFVKAFANKLTKFDNEVYYSEIDSEFMVSDYIVDQTITNAYYLADDGTLKELVVADGLITGLDGVVYNGYSKLGQYIVNITDAQGDVYYHTTTAIEDKTAAPGYANPYITLYVKTESGLYAFTKVFVVHKAIDDKAELDFNLYPNRSNNYIIFTSNIDASGAVYPLISENGVAGMTNTVFDGNGYYIDNLTTTVRNWYYDTFFGKYSNTVVMNLGMFNLLLNSPSSTYYIYATLMTSQGGCLFDNCHIKLNPASLFNGLYYFGSQAHVSIVNNVIIDYMYNDNVSGGKVMLSNNNGSYIVPTAYRGSENSFFISPSSRLTSSNAGSIYALNTMPTNDVTQVETTYKIGSTTYYAKLNKWTDGTSTRYYADFLDSIYAYENEQAFKNAVSEGLDISTFENNSNWNCSQGMPMWASYVKANVYSTYTHSFSGEDNEIKLADENYTFSASAYGVDATITKIEANNPIIVVDGNSIKVEDLPEENTVVEVSVQYSVYGFTFNEVYSITVVQPIYDLTMQGEGEDAQTENLTVSGVNVPYTFTASTYGTPATVVSVAEKVDSDYVVIENNVLKAITLPTFESETITLVITYEGNKVREYDITLAPLSNSVVSDRYFYSQVDKAILGITDAIGGDVVKEIYYVPSTAESYADYVKLSYSEIEGLTGFAIKAVSNMNWSKPTYTLTTTITGADGVQLDPVSFTSASFTMSGGVKLLVVGNSKTYTLNTVTPTTQTLDQASDLPLSELCDSDPNTAGLQGYVMLKCNIDGTGYEYPTPTTKWGQDFILDGAGYSLKNFTLNNSTTGLFGPQTSLKYTGSNTGARGSYITALGVVDLVANNSVAFATNLNATSIVSSFIRISNKTKNYKGLMGGAFAANAVAPHFIGVLYEYEPIYTADNIADFGLEQVPAVDTVRPYYPTEYFLSSKAVGHDVFNTYQQFYESTFISDGNVGYFDFTGLGDGMRFDMFNTAPATKYAFANGYIDKPIKWANTSTVAALETKKIGNGTLLLPEGQSLAGQYIPECWYKNTSAAYDLAGTGYNSYCHIDFDTSVLDYVNVNDGDTNTSTYIMLASAKGSFRYGNYFATDATTYYPSKYASMRGYPSSEAAKANSGTTTMNAKFFNKVSGSKPTWKNA